MLFLGILPILVVFTYAAETSSDCHSNVKKFCKKESTSISCDASYGGIANLEEQLQIFVNHNLYLSFYFLLLSTHFGNLKEQRDGFKKLYRKYSDDMWEDTVDTMKFMVKRGGKISFAERHMKNTSEVFEYDEIESLAKALDKHKAFMGDAFELHDKASRHGVHDPSIAHFIEEKYLDTQTERIRDLAGYVNDLKRLSAKNQGLSLYLFDEFLQKSL